MSTSCNTCNSTGFPIAIQNVQNIFSPACTPMSTCTSNANDIKNYVYLGPDLPCSTVSSGMNMEEVVIRFDSKMCAVIGDYSTYNTSCLDDSAPITTQKQFVEAISAAYCTLKTTYDTFVGTTFPAYQTTLNTRFGLIEVPGTVNAVSGVVNTDTLQQVLTKYGNKLTDIQNVKLSLAGVVWDSCFVVGTPPTTIAGAFSLIESQICSLKADVEATGSVLPTFNNTGTCLPGTLTSADTLQDTIGKIKTRLCTSPTFDINTLTWGCTTKPSSVATDLQAAFQTVLTKIDTFTKEKLTFSSDFDVALTNGSDPCAGKTVTLVGGGGGGTDRYVAVNVGDTSPGTLDTKLIEGDGIELDVTTTPGTMIINATGLNTDTKVKTRSADATAGYLEDKITGIVDSGSGITVSTNTNITTEKVEISTTVDAGQLWDYMLSFLAGDADAKTAFCAQVMSCLPDCIIPPNVTVVYDNSVDVPSPPTAGVVDDTANTFNWTNNPSFTALSDYEKTTDGGLTYTTVTAKPITGLTGAIAIGQVGVRVKAIGTNPASSTLFNSTAYTV